MKSTLCIILAHGKVQETFDRHWDLWARHGFDIVVGCPIDDPIKCSVPVFSGWKSGYYNNDANHRITCLLSYIACMPFSLPGHPRANRAVVFEYDSICLAANPTVHEALHGIIQPNLDPLNRLAPRYVCAPWTLDADSADRMLRVAQKYPSLTEGGADDRYLSALAWLAGVPVLGHPEGGLGRNTIASADWPLMIETVEKGGQWFHGIKTADTLELLKQAWTSQPK